MTRDEAYRRAIEAGARAQFDKQNSYFGAPKWNDLSPDMRDNWLSMAETIASAYLAAMVLPIEDAPDDGTWILASGLFANVGPERWWTQAKYRDGAWCDETDCELYTPTHFTFLPEPPK